MFINLQLGTLEDFFNILALLLDFATRILASHSAFVNSGNTS